MRRTAILLVSLTVEAACGGGGGSPDGAGVPDAAIADGASEIDAVISFTGTVTGRVVANGAPVEAAIVKFGGRPEETLSAADGTFTLTVLDPPVRLDQIALTAGRSGYQSGGVRVVDPAAPQEIEIDELTIADNPAYEFKSPDLRDGSPFCMHCHPHQYAGWSTSRHAEAARDPMLHDLYNGTALGWTTAADCAAHGGTWRTGKAYGVDGAADKCYVDGGSVLADLNPGVCGGAGQPTCDDPSATPPPNAGPCADCHAPATTNHVPGATNLNGVSGIAFDKGVHCDFCHKIQSVTVNDRPGVNGAINLLRPGPPGPLSWSDPEVHFAPYSDVILFIMGAVATPQFRTSELCSACHQWSDPGFRPGDAVDPVKWPDGLPIQDTYYEWSHGPYATAGVQCRNCHQQGAPWDTATIDLDALGPDPYGIRGWPRAYGEVREHDFAARQAADDTPRAEGDLPRASLRNPIAIAIDPVRAGGQLTVNVALMNTSAGHSLPTGTPSRALILLVQAEALGAPLPATGGYTVPWWVGSYASGVLGADATLVGDQLTLAAGWPADVGPGTVIRFARGSGAWDDYPGNRWFGDPARTPAEKGMEITEPVGEAVVLSIAGSTATLDRVVTAVDGDRVFAGEAAPAGGLAIDDELPVTPLAGAPGYAFGKVMRDRDGNDGVVFFRAVDMASDNRIPSGATATTSHVFDASGVAGAPITVTVTLLYRRHPWPTAHARGWPAVDTVRVQQVVTAP